MRAPAAHRSARATPPTPVTGMVARKSAAAKPVPQTMTSAGCSTPSPVTSPSGVIRSTASVTRSTFGRVSAGR